MSNFTHRKERESIANDFRKIACGVTQVHHQNIDISFQIELEIKQLKSIFWIYNETGRNGLLETAYRHCHSRAGGLCLWGGGG